MKAAIYEQPGLLIIKDVPEPEAGPGEAIVQVKTCGICHTDVAIAKGRYFPRLKPIILGHEIAGIVARIGSNENNIKLNDRVIVYQCITCNHCARCKEGRQNICYEIKNFGMDIDGGYANYIKVPSQNLIKLPDSISFTEGSIITDALSTAFHGVARLNLVKDEVVVILGAGVIGLNAVQVASKIFGAKVIAIDLEEWKLDLALHKGAWKVVKVGNGNDAVTALKALNVEVDAAMEFIGNPDTYRQAIEAVRRGGRVVAVGATTQPVTFNPFRVFKEEVSITGSYSGLKSEIPGLIDYVKNGELAVNDMVTNVFKLEDINNAIEMLADQKERSLRAVVEF